MENLSSYIFLTECILSLAKSLKGSLIVYDGFDYYIDADVFMYCVEKAPGQVDDSTIYKILCSIIHGTTELDNISILRDGYLVGKLVWNNNDDIYEKYD